MFDCLQGWQCFDEIRYNIIESPVVGMGYDGSGCGVMANPVITANNHRIQLNLITVNFLINRSKQVVTVMYYLL
jgi:hypothetical protein